MKKAFIILIITYSPFYCVYSARSSIRPPTTITHVGLAYDENEGLFTMHVQTNGDQPEVSEPITWGHSGVTVTFFNAVFSDDFSQGDAAGPVMAYRIGAENGNIVLWISFITDSVSTNIVRDRTSSDVVIEFQEKPIDPAISYAPGNVGANTDSSAEASSGSNADSTVSIPLSADATVPTVKNTKAAGASFRSALLSTARALSQNRETEFERVLDISESNPSLNATDPSKSIEPAERWRLDTIVLDAGHGGWDNGAVSRAGLKEKDLSLSVAKILGQMLEQNLGMHVEYTRRSDVYIPLADRGRIANASGGKLFVSIHANQSKAKSARGTETYFLGVHRSDSARVVMERENEVVELEDNFEAYLRMDDGEIATKRLTQSAYMQQSEKLAALIQAGFSSDVGRKNRGVKQAGFYVLFGASMPAVLVELGFMSNSREAGFLSTDDGQQQMALAIFQAIAKFKNEYEKALNVTKL